MYKFDNIPVETVPAKTFIFKIVGIGLSLLDFVSDWNLVIHYFIYRRVAEFIWTLMFLVIPSLAIAFVTLRMDSQDQERHPVMKRKWLQIVVLVLQLSTILRSCYSFLYAVKSRYAEYKRKEAVQRKNYHLMVKEDCDGALLSVFETFLEGAPQVVLQMSLMILHLEFKDLAVLQMLKITGSLVSLGLCLALYQRAIRVPQEGKFNMDFIGTTLQATWHGFVIVSRIISITMLVILVGQWTTLACACHIAFMGTIIHLYYRPAFYENNKLAEVAFSYAFGCIYLFEFIATTDGTNRYKYVGFYSLCLIENFVCACLWYFNAGKVISSSMDFYPVLVCSVVPFIVGICFMLVYYAFFHPNPEVGLCRENVGPSIEEKEKLPTNQMTEFP